MALESRGYEVCERDEGQRGLQEAVKVQALENGAVDYVTKPFGSAGLLARLDVLQRRRFKRQSPEITARPLTVDLLHHRMQIGEAASSSPRACLRCSACSPCTRAAS
jgi:DNA-binding response OmpR family regulator